MSPQDLLRFQTVGQRVVRRQVGNACPHAAVHLRIELVGSRLLNRDAEVSVLRHVRDDLLATTGPGREWIALFERAQTPLMAMLLGDQRLSDMAANLVRVRAGWPGMNDRLRPKGTLSGGCC
jgi:hypothetical protein